jgi:CheY-like chemotaxis protein
METESAGDRPPPALSQAIQALLERHGVPERKRLMVLESAIGVAYQQVRRRMMGDTPWTVEDLQRISAHFGEPVFRLLGALIEEQPGEPAVLRMGGTQVPCSIWLGPAGAAGVGPFVAVRTPAPASWSVVLADEAGEQPTFPIRRLVVEPEPPRRVAVLDDDDNLGQAVAEFLRLKGLDAVSYTSPEQLRTALETTHFDGYVLDWVLGGESAAELLPLIRAKTPAGPVIILTGQIGAGANEDDLAAATKAHRIQLYEKPTRSMLLFNALELGFAPRHAAP